METETFLRITAVVIAGCILLSTVNWMSTMYSFINWFKKKKVIEPENVTVDFLEVVAVWHDLKEKCTQYGLDQAVEKIDEVFPLLNEEEGDV